MNKSNINIAGGFNINKRVVCRLAMKLKHAYVFKHLFQSS